MFEQLRRLFVSSALVSHVLQNDAVLGDFTRSPDGPWWDAIVSVGSHVLGFKLGGASAPDPSLMAHARDIVRNFPQFRALLAAFLILEAGRLPGASDEIRQLEP